MPAPQISPLPNPPSRSQSPETFSVDADAFLGALPDFQSEANDQADYLDALAIAVDADAASADADAAAAAASEAAAAASEAAAALSETNAAASEVAAAASESAAALSETNAAASEVAAAASAAEAEAIVAGIGFQDIVFINAAMSPYSITSATNGKLIACDTTGGNIVINLPQVSSLTLPFTTGTKKTTSDGNTVVINCTGSDTFDDGTTSKSVNVPAGFTLLPDIDTSPDVWVAIGFGGATAGPVTGSGLTMSTDKLLGRNTAGTGAIEEIAHASLAEMQAGTETALRGMSPANISQAIDALASASPSLEAIASGSLADGSRVIVNADGTVSVIAFTSQLLGSPTVFESASTDTVRATYDSANQRVVIAYRDMGNLEYGTAVVGTVSGTSISFGTPVLFSAARTQHMSVAYDSVQQKVVIAYRNEAVSNYGTARVGTVSGTSISFGSSVVFRSAEVFQISAVYDSANQKVVIAYRDRGNADRGTAVVGTVSGTSISFGGSVVFDNLATSNIAAVYDSANQKVVIAYQDGGIPTNGEAIVGTVSGTSISFGTSVVFKTGSVDFISPVFDSVNQKVVIAYRDQTNLNNGTAVVGTVSGTSISFGTGVVFNSAATYEISATYDANARKVLIAYQNQGNSSFGTAITGNVSGTSISFDTPFVFESAQTNGTFAIYDSVQQRVVIPYADVGNGTFGTAVVIKNESTTLTAENFIGFSNGVYTNGQTATIQIIGSVDDAQSGLTAGQSYFVQKDGSLALTAAIPSVFAGTAVAANKIIVKG